MEGNFSFDPPRASVGYNGDAPDSLGRVRRELSTLVMNFSLEESGRIEMGIDAKLAKKAEMNVQPVNDPTPAPCRRAGLDRRWISSKNHHPERRRGGDRRTVKKRSFSDPLVLEVPGRAYPLTAGFEAASEATESESPVVPDEVRTPGSFEDTDGRG